MIDADLLQHAVTIHRLTAGAGKDEHGNATATWVGDPATTPGFMQTDGETEVLVKGEVVIAEWRVYFQPTVVVTTRDKLAWGVRFFQVIGINEEQEPGARHHLLLFLREVQGGPLG